MKATGYAIKDRPTGRFFLTKHDARTGWYGEFGPGIRLYRSEGIADRAMKSGSHHVTYPGNRELAVVPIYLEEGYR